MQPTFFLCWLSQSISILSLVAEKKAPGVNFSSATSVLVKRIQSQDSNDKRKSIERVTEVEAQAQEAGTEERGALTLRKEKGKERSQGEGRKRRAAGSWPLGQ